MPQPFETVTAQPRVRRSTAIADKIRNMLLNGDLQPGQRLPTEEKLGALFQVSRTTLREAIQMLRVSGLLDVTPGRGTFVRIPDISRAMDDLALYGACHAKQSSEIDYIRLSFQRDMLENVAQAPSQEKNKLYDYIIARDGNAEDNAKQEEQWHLMLAEMGGGEIAKAILGALLKIQQKERIERLKDEDETMRTLSVQMRLTNALLDGDVELSKRVITAYLGCSAHQAKMQNAKNAA